MQTQFLYFLMTVVVINVAPGPAMMFVLQQSQRNGLQAGLAAAVGIEAGVFVYVVLSALGVIAIFDLYPGIYRALQLVGAFYLLYLAYKAWPRRRVAEAAPVTASNKGVMLKGLLINLTNPKIAVFFFSLIPQFIPQGSGTLKFISYGLIFNLGGLITNTSVAVLSHRVGRLLLKATWFDYVPPLLFIVIAGISIMARF